MWSQNLIRQEAPIIFLSTSSYAHNSAVSTSAMHNIIASERSGVECARYEMYAHCELLLRVFRILRYAAPVEIEIYISIAKNRALDTTM